MASLRIIPTLLGFLFLFGVHVNANSVANDAPENESSWLKQWMNLVMGRNPGNTLPGCNFHYPVPGFNYPDPPGTRK